MKKIVLATYILTFAIISKALKTVASDFRRLRELLKKRASQQAIISYARGRRLREFRKELHLHSMAVEMAIGVDRIEDLELGRRIMTQNEYYKIISFYRRIKERNSRL